MLTNFENFISDYQMVECFRYFDTIFSEIRNFFDREITDLFLSRINRHPVYNEYIFLIRILISQKKLGKGNESIVRTLANSRISSFLRNKIFLTRATFCLKFRKWTWKLILITNFCKRSWNVLEGRIRMHFYAFLFTKKISG